MPRRPGGGGPTPPGSIEDGLRELVRDPGPDLRKLIRPAHGGLRALVQSAGTPVGWPLEVKAATILMVIHEVVAEQSNPRWRSAAEAALRLPPDRYAGTEYDSLAHRLHATAVREGYVGGELRSRIDAYRGYWVTAAKHIADALEDRLLALNRSDSWGRYRKDMPAKPPSHLPMSFDRSDILYTFEGQCGVQAISYRWVTAEAPVDAYGVVGWYFNEPDAPVEVVPLANCELDGDSIERPEGGRLARLRFDHVLSPGESYFFAYRTVFHSQQPCRPIIRYETRGSYAGHFTVRAQFDPRARPSLCWVLDAGFHDQGLDIPHLDDASVLPVAANGYVEHTFDQFDRGRKYGLRWFW